MNEEQSGRPRGRRRSRAEVDQLIAEYEGSGLTRQQFCAKHGLALVTLDRYRKRRREGGASSPDDKRFLRVELRGGKPAGSDGPGNELAVVLRSGRRIELRGGFDADLLLQLVQVLEQI